jgi:hypothetical protein
MSTLCRVVHHYDMRAIEVFTAGTPRHGANATDAWRLLVQPSLPIAEIPGARAKEQESSLPHLWKADTLFCPMIDEQLLSSLHGWMSMAVSIL